MEPYWSNMFPHPSSSMSSVSSANETDGTRCVFAAEGINDSSVALFE